MKVDTVITLDNDVNVLLIDKATYNDNNYFLAIELDSNEEPTDKSAILKEIIDTDGTYVEKENDPKILEELFNMFAKSFEKFVANLPEE